MILSYTDFLFEIKEDKKKDPQNSGKKKQLKESCPACKKKICECDLPDCGAGFLGPEMSNPVYH